VVTALNPLIGYENAALIAKHALANGTTIAAAAEALGVMSQTDAAALIVPERLTQPGGLPKRG
jgi:aspartate ammonia-lyase